MELTQERVRELFDYREDGCLIAKERARGRKFGKPVGSISKNGELSYLITMISGKLYKVHRLIFLWHNGYMPEEIDHQDCNGLNNRIENLRDADSAKNKYNRRRNKNNTSGFKGVSFDKRKGKFAASIMVNRKHIFLGYHASPVDAHEDYKKAANFYFGEFSKAG